MAMTSSVQPTGSATSPTAAGSTEIVIIGELPDTDDLWDQYEEMHHRVRFTVTSGGVTSPVTGWHVSGDTSIHV